VKPGPVWLFDLDDTLHDAHHASMGEIREAMGVYIRRELGLTEAESNALRTRYWKRYGATLLGLVRHHGVQAGHFLCETHALPGLEGHVHTKSHDLVALRRLPGRKFLLTNAPLAYALRVLDCLGLKHCFEGVIAMEQMAMFGNLRPKPDARMLRHVLARMQLRPADCVLVEDTLVHQKSARRIGMQTVWMQRWLRVAALNGQAQPGLLRRPGYVGQRISALSALQQRHSPAAADGFGATPHD
jgi:putative hydrolase of the HAD superfamily